LRNPPGRAIATFGSASVAAPAAAPLSTSRRESSVTVKDNVQPLEGLRDRSGA
jgi:hypothetical protein